MNHTKTKNLDSIRFILNHWKASQQSFIHSFMYRATLVTLHESWSNTIKDGFLTHCLLICILAIFNSDCTPTTRVKYNIKFSGGTSHFYKSIYYKQLWEVSQALNYDRTAQKNLKSHRMRCVRIQSISHEPLGRQFTLVKLNQIKWSPQIIRH